jgi:flagellar motility protein MotE (MotC chaperone)
MIVTRRRPKKRNYGKLVLPLVAIAALAGALYWPPSHNVIANGPLRPVWGVLGGVGSQAARPLTFAAQQQQIADQNRKLRDEAALREADRQAAENKDKQIAALRTQVVELQSSSKATPLPAPVPKPTVAAAGAGLAGATAPVPDDIRRTAAYWGSMDAEKAAAIAVKLPDDYVNRVFAQMQPDSVADIMNALPANVAARLATAAGSADVAASAK